MSKKVLVVIPYLAKEEQGGELELAVEGWKQHFKEKCNIVIVGDWSATVGRVFDNDKRDKKDNKKRGKIADIEFIQCPQVSPLPGQYLPHLDHVNKFRKVYEQYPDSEGFIYACDDMYAVRDFNLKTVVAPKLPHENYHVREFDWQKEGGWLSDLGKTRELCENQGFTQKNWVCHLPIYYRWDKLIEIMDKYDCDHVSYVLENIYYNQISIYYAINDIPVLDSAYFQYEIKTGHPGIETAEDAGKIWITNANCGWSTELDTLLRKHYKL